jgi:hypothetical protein
MLLNDKDDRGYSIPVNVTPGFRDKSTVDISFIPCEWLTIPRDKISQIKFI